MEICVLENFTSSASETIYLTLNKMKVNGSLVIKDSDNKVKVHFDKDIKNMIVGYDIQEHSEVTNIPAKSFLIVIEQNIVQDIIEKKIVSNIICLGIYCFKNVQDFMQAYIDMNSKKISGEMYISHLISYLLAYNKYIFEVVMAESYNDWGNINDMETRTKKIQNLFY